MLETVDFYREILDNLYDGIFFVDTDGRITYWNKGSASLTGYSAADVVGRNYCDIFKPLDKHGNNLCEISSCPIRRVLESSQASEVEAYVCHKEGHLLPISIRICPVFRSTVSPVRRFLAVRFRGATTPVPKSIGLRM